MWGAALSLCCRNPAIFHPSNRMRAACTVLLLSIFHLVPSSPVRGSVHSTVLYYSSTQKQVVVVENMSNAIDGSKGAEATSSVQRARSQNSRRIATLSVWVHLGAVGSFCRGTVAGWKRRHGREHDDRQGRMRPAPRRRRPPEWSVTTER